MSEDERNKESDVFKDVGELPENFGQTSGRRSSVGALDRDLADEIKLLCAEGSLSETVAEGLLKRQQKYGAHPTTTHEVEKAPLSEDGLPNNWSSEANKHAVFAIIELKKGNSEYDKIESDLNAAGITVLNIERLQNTRHLDRFKGEIKDVKNHRSPGFGLNICYLYHGTNGDKLRLCEEGLDQRLSRMGHFGRGIYFSDNPAKCVQYTKTSDNSSETPYLLRCRVLLGDSKEYPSGEYDKDLRREPEKEEPTEGWRYYDSVKGCPKDYNEYVVYESRRAMIEYIVTFSVESGLTQGLSDGVAEHEDCYGDSSSDDQEVEESSEEEVAADLTSDDNDDKKVTEVIQPVSWRDRQLKEENQEVQYWPPPKQEVGESDEKLSWRQCKPQIGEEVGESDEKPQVGEEFGESDEKQSWRQRHPLLGQKEFGESDEKLSWRQRHSLFGHKASQKQRAKEFGESDEKLSWRRRHPLLGQKEFSESDEKLSWRQRHPLFGQKASRKQRAKEFGESDEKLSWRWRHPLLGQKVQPTPRLVFEDPGVKKNKHTINTEETNRDTRQSTSSSTRKAGKVPAAQSLSISISEFMQSTGEEDSTVAKQYLQRADMDVNLAITYYYTEM